MARLCSYASRDVLERNNSILIIDCAKAILPHTLCKKELTIVTWGGWKNTYSGDAPDTESCSTKLRNVSQLLYNSLLCMNCPVTKSRATTPCSNIIMRLCNNIAALHNNCHMKVCSAMPASLTRREVRGMLLNNARQSRHS